MLLKPAQVWITHKYAHLQTICWSWVENESIKEDWYTSRPTKSRYKRAVRSLGPQSCFQVFYTDFFSFMTEYSHIVRLLVSSWTLGYIHILLLFLLLSQSCKCNHKLWNSAGFTVSYVCSVIQSQTTKCVRMQKDYTKLLYFSHNLQVLYFSSCCSRWYVKETFLMQKVANQSAAFQSDVEISSTWLICNFL